MGYLSDATCAAFRGRFNIGLFFRLNSNPPLHLWWGVSDVEATMDAMDVAGTKYLGGGLLVDVPDGIEVLVNGIADRADWVLSGIPDYLTANLVANAPNVIGCRVDFGIASLDERWQPQSDIVSLWAGTSDFWSEEQPLQKDPSKPKTRRLTLATFAGDISRALQPASTWTDLDQLALSPTDKFCERVPINYQGRIIRWPRY